MKTAVMQFGAVMLVGVAVGACKDPSAGKPRATGGAAVPERREATGARPTAPVAWTISPDGSQVEFVGAKVTASHPGGFSKFSGRIVADPTQLHAAAISLEIETDSLFSDNEKLTTHLKSADFFDVTKFPKASFTSTDIRAGGGEKATHTVTGNLTLHGVTKSIAFPASVAVSGDTIVATSEFSINRKDFGIVYPGMRENLIRDNVLIKLSINAKRAAR